MSWLPWTVLVGVVVAIGYAYLSGRKAGGDSARAKAATDAANRATERNAINADVARMSDPALDRELYGDK